MFAFCSVFVQFFSIFVGCILLRGVLLFLYSISGGEKMKTMLIAVCSEIITEELVRTFQNEYVVYTCNRGDDAQRLLQELKPDILIISLSLSTITGLELLQQTEFTPPIILALTNYLSDFIVQEAQTAGVGALIRLPCSIGFISARLHSLLLHQ